MDDIRKVQLIAVILLAGTAEPWLRGEVISLGPESQITLEGSATLHDWQCSTRRVTGEIESDVPYFKVQQFFERIEERGAPSREERGSMVWVAPGNIKSALVRIEAARFDCGSKGLERDMRKALKTSQHPFITYHHEKLTDITVARQGGQPELVLQTLGRLSLAGVESWVLMELHVTMQDHGLRLKTTQRLNMNGFGIKPPTALFGLIRAQDDVGIHFDLTLIPSSP
jgi:hypothetical protein